MHVPYIHVAGDNRNRQLCKSEGGDVQNVFEAIPMPEEVRTVGVGYNYTMVVTGKIRPSHRLFC